MNILSAKILVFKISDPLLYSTFHSKFEFMVQAEKLSKPAKPAAVIVTVLVLVVIINVRSFALNIQDFCAPLN